MTKAQATALQVKWKQQGEPPSRCALSIHELAEIIRGDDGYVTGTYHCRECGDEIVHNYKAPPFSNMPLSD